MADSKKLSFSKSPILIIFLRKFHGLVLGLVELIDATERALMWVNLAVRLSNISSITGEKCMFLGRLKMKKNIFPTNLIWTYMSQVK